MTDPALARLFRVSEETWPAARTRTLGPITLRDAPGGGSRVNAATVSGEVSSADLDRAEGAMRAAGFAPLFKVRQGQETLDEALAARGYRIKDPVLVYHAPIAALTHQRPPPVTSFACWPPLASQREIWAKGGIGPGRLAVMDRAAAPKTALLGRIDDTPAACAFVGISDGCAMLHALEVAPVFRRRRVGHHLTHSAAFWAQANGAKEFALLVTRENPGAIALYASLGLSPVGHYHYRILPE